MHSNKKGNSLFFFSYITVLFKNLNHACFHTALTADSEDTELFCLLTGLSKGKSKQLRYEESVRYPDYSHFLPVLLIKTQKR